MAIVDGTSDIEINPAGDHLSVRIPLPAEPSWGWVRSYLPLAREQAVPAEVREEPGGAVLQVAVRLGMSRQETFALLDAALRLVEEAKVADRQRAEALGATEAYVREWWRQPRR